MDEDPQTFLRLRKKSSKDSEATITPSDVETRPPSPTSREEVVWGKTPGGEVFRVPTTHDVLTLFHPGYPKSHIDLLNLGLLGFQLVLFYTLSRPVAKVFFFLYFVFWRLAYDVGLGWVLTKQSKKKWIVREVQRLGWLDEARMPSVRGWIRNQLAGKMGKDYSFDDLPLEYNTWLLFRQAVDIILLNDFLAYCMFAFACFRIPDGLSTTVHIMRWIGGFALIAFNLWVKTEAHNVVKDYGWYWGDVFFQRGALVFDGVFELAPHPMYSVGYAGYYGLSLIVGSYPVLFISLFGHAAQFGFLVFFENPHIERTYGQRKLLAQRTPLFPSRTSKSSEDASPSHSRQESTDSVMFTDLPTPAATDGETATETELETETEADPVHASASRPRIAKKRSSNETRRHAPSQHDLLHQYFRKDAILFHNLDLLRASDAQLVLVVGYVSLAIFLPHLSEKASLALHFTHALAWCLFHTFGLGLLLKAQSESKFLVRHFLKHYHYPRNDKGKGAVQEAFSNWKTMYNMSMCMTYVSFVGLTWKTYSIPHDWTVGNELLRHTLGLILVLVHVWATLESYEVLGLFGWFFGDFFMDEFSAQLEYTGIYRYLNNPEIMSGAAFFGMAMISGSKLAFALAVVRLLAQWWFLSNVENPHMRKLYGDSLRSDAGFVKVIKKVARKNAHILESRAGRHAPEIRRVAKEVKGTFDKVYEETAEKLEDLIAKSRPKLSEVVQDTKVLLQQSRERLVIARLANDLSLYDRTKYRISVIPSAVGRTLRFHLGEPIKVKWQAPSHHSRRDWIGIYRVGANASELVTKTSSIGKWVPVHGEEWDGEYPLSLDRPNRPDIDAEEGEVVFSGATLPWQTGSYEIRYHHDGKHNVMALLGPVEIYVQRPTSLDPASVRSSLTKIVSLCLDSDPSLIPLSCKNDADETFDDEDDRDPDDFRFWSERQAKRISMAVEQAFGVELTPEVIIADANLGALTHRILVAKELFSG
ncbi:phosphatidylethanolamine N-methyltransferase [Steccherinum ochraceum]|uniref:Phosphatidylethanolamine N-methyltransferase n=1 Tax=Steccherinum ochraceum TaxID=92696 RepID=A0A4R0RH11_9APHY|nr:phosphatidylethanolamine N-methyltransferase [Steccherinum ochraceum]